MRVYWFVKGEMVELEGNWVWYFVSLCICVIFFFGELVYIKKIKILLMIVISRVLLVFFYSIVVNLVRFEIVFFYKIWRKDVIISLGFFYVVKGLM